MKKILAGLATIAMATSCVSTVSACGEPFNSSNLSTWGSNQKELISKSYLASATPYQNVTWNTWVVSLNELTALLNAFNQINPNINDLNMLWVYAPIPDLQAKLKPLLAKGIEVYVRGYNDNIVGSWKMEIKGSI